MASPGCSTLLLFSSLHLLHLDIIDLRGLLMLILTVLDFRDLSTARHVFSLLMFHAVLLLLILTTYSILSLETSYIELFSYMELIFFLYARVFLVSIYKSLSFNRFQLNAIRSLNLLNCHPSKLEVLFQYNFLVLLIKGTKFCVNSNLKAFTPFNYYFPLSPGLVLLNSSS